jgi:hypothetical protein
MLGSLPQAHVRLSACQRGNLRAIQVLTRPSNSLQPI